MIRAYFVAASSKEATSTIIPGFISFRYAKMSAESYVEIIIEKKRGLGALIKHNSWNLL